jgi:hypothetical protein
MDRSVFRTAVCLASVLAAVSVPKTSSAVPDTSTATTSPRAAAAASTPPAATVATAAPTEVAAEAPAPPSPPEPMSQSPNPLGTSSGVLPAMQPASDACEARPLVTGNKDYALHQCDDGRPTTARIAPDTLLSGTASFLAERAAQVTSQWLIDEVLVNLCASGKIDVAGVSDWEGLFPKTCELHEASTSTSYPSHAAVRDAIRDDLKELPARLLTPKLGEANAKLFVGVTEELLANIRARWQQKKLDGKAVIGVVAELRNVAAVKNECPVDGATKPTNPTACYLMAVGWLASDYLDRDNRAPQQVISKETLRALAAALSSPDDQVKVDYDAVLAQLSLAQAKLTDLRQEYENLVLDVTESGRRHRAALAMEMAAVVLDAADEIIDRIAIGPTNEKPSQHAQLTLRLLRNAMRASAAITAGHYSKAVVPISEIIADLPDSANVPSSLRQLASLAIDIADAETSDDVSGALSAAAAPSDAWRMKRSAFVASVGALVGVSSGYQISEKGLHKGWTASAFSPIGLDFSWPTGHNTTLGIFVSALDLGNLVAREVYSKDDDTVEESHTDVGVKEVTSLGMYPRLGLGRSPFVLAVGASWSPDLLQMSLKNGESRSADVWRFGAALGADVPIIPF